MWLECIVVVIGWCCKEVYRFPHNMTSLRHLFGSFLQQHPYTKITNISPTQKYFKLAASHLAPVEGR